MLLESISHYFLSFMCSLLALRVYVKIGAEIVVLDGIIYVAQQERYIISVFPMASDHLKLEVITLFQGILICFAQKSVHGLNSHCRFFFKKINLCSWSKEGKGDTCLKYKKGENNVQVGSIFSMKPGIKNTGHNFNVEPQEIL